MGHIIAWNPSTTNEFANDLHQLKDNVQNYYQLLNSRNDRNGFNFCSNVVYFGEGTFIPLFSLSLYSYRTQTYFQKNSAPLRAKRDELSGGKT